MKTDIELLEIMIKARELGITPEEFSAFKEHHNQATQATYVPEAKAEEILSPLSVLDDLSEEEILFWHSPYYDELQLKKRTPKERDNDNV